MMKKIILGIIGVVLILFAGGFFFYNSIFGAVDKNAEPERFIVSLSESRGETIKKISEGGFIKSLWGFNITLKVSDIRPGGYKISKSMNAWEMAKALEKPYMEWVVIPEGLRKEEIAEIIAKKINWGEKEKTEWVMAYKSGSNYAEGVYFPDTYLIPKDEKPKEVVERFISKFNEKFKPYGEKFAKDNVKWTTALKLASIVQREAAGKNDMPIIAGILWNRLLKDMRLETDSTLQYARDTNNHYSSDLTSYKSEGDWWKPISLEDKKISSPYNTYKNKGLPPTPITNPGIEAISAVLNPTKTECLFYLHDSKGEIHSAKTYEEHKANIEKYLK